MSLTICAEYFVIDWNFSYIEDTSCIHGLSSDFQIVLSNSIYGRIGFLLTYRYLFTLKMNYKKNYTQPLSASSVLASMLAIFRPAWITQKSSLLFINRKTCILCICKQNLYVCDHTFILSYLWCTCLIYWEFSAISIMYFKINIIFHINQVFDLKKKLNYPKMISYIFFSHSLLILVLCLIQSNAWN